MPNLDSQQSGNTLQLTLVVGRPWIVMGWAFFIFSMGAIAGAASMLIWHFPPSASEPAPTLSQEFAQRLRRDLDLADQQTRQVETIVSKYEPSFLRTHDEARDKLRNELDEMNEEILPILNDRQREIHNKEWKRMFRPERKKDRTPNSGKPFPANKPPHRRDRVDRAGA